MEINDFGGEGGKGFNVKQGLVIGERNLVGGGMELVRKGVMAHVYTDLLGFCKDGMKQLMRGV